MDLNEWIKEVAIEDIPESYQDLAANIGIEALLRLAAFLGGTTTYIPKIDCLVLAARDRLIIREFDKGVKPKEIAIKFDLTDVWVRKVIDQYITERDQLRLFDMASGE